MFRHVVLVFLIGIAFQAANSKPVSYYLKVDEGDDADDFMKKAITEELVDEMMKSISPADRQSIIKELMQDNMPPQEYSSDLMPVRNARPRANSYNVLNGKIEDGRFIPGNKINLNELDYGLRDNKHTYSNHLPYESSPTDEDLILKKNFGLSEKELQLLDLVSQDRSSLTRKSHDKTGLYGTSRSSQTKANAHRLPKSPNQAGGKPRHLVVSKKQPKVLASDRKFVDKTQSKIVYKDGHQPDVSDKKLKSPTTAKENPVEMIIKEIENIALPQEAKSSRERKTQPVNRNANRFGNSLREPQKHKSTNDQETSYLGGSSMLPLDSPASEDSTWLLREMGLVPKQRLKTRQTLGLPLDESLQESKKLRQDFDSGISDDDIDYLIKLFQDGANSKSLAEDGIRYDQDAKQDYEMNPPTDVSSNNMDSLSSEIERILKEKKDYIGSFQSDEAASKNIQNNEQEDNSERSAGLLKQHDRHDNMAEDVSLTEASTGLIGSTKKQKIQPPTGDDNIIKQIEARVAQLERRLTDKSGLKNEKKKRDRLFRM